MLTQIKLRNFKVFKNETVFPLSKINLLTGINGRGKSTLLQSLLVMKQSVDYSENTNYLLLNGNCLSLGTFKDVKNSNLAITDDIVIGYKLTAFNQINFEISYKMALGNDDRKLIIREIILTSQEELVAIAGDNDNGNMVFDMLKLYETDVMAVGAETPTSVIDYYNDDLIINSIRYAFGVYKNLLPNIGFMRTQPQKFLFNFSYIFQFNKIHYISADRIGAKEIYSKYNLDFFISVDKKGENVASVISKTKDLEIDKKLYLGDNARTVINQTGEWLSEVLGTNVSIIIDDFSNDFYVTLSFRINGKDYKPSNVGFGYSYILPIIVSGLIAKSGEILIVENPEAHLHPRAQSKLTKFLAKVASCGVQVFIESHSDHILNGLRVCVKNKELTPDDVSVMYFSADRQTDETQIHFPKIDKNGRIDDWQEGFFDEWDNSLMELL